jgi:AcrR family transcriptional regulator
MRPITHDAARDGRTERSARTRKAVADALLELIEEGELRPSAARIAERAGVGIRTVFHHYQDLEALFQIVADTQLERMATAARVVPRTGPLDRRIDAFVGERARLHEMIAPVRRAALLIEPFSPAIANRLAWVRRRARTEVARVFADELARFVPARRRDVHEAVTVTASWSSWEALRVHQGLTIAQAKRVLAGSIGAFLQERT